MPSTISVTYLHAVSIVETFSGDAVSPSDPTVTFIGLDETGVLDAASTVPATKHAEFDQALTAGAATIDLTALPSSTGGTIDGTGLKVQLAEFRNDAANANDIVITFGAATPYLLLGAAFKITLKPGQSTGPMLLKDAAPDVAAGAKHIDISGTAAQVLECRFVLG